MRDRIDGLNRSWPGMRDRLCEPGAIRQHVSIFVDYEKATLDTALRQGSVVHSIPAVSGG